MPSNCPACPRIRPEGKYLCVTCWGRLPKETRGALKRRDRTALKRAQRLFKEIRLGTPLPWIKIH